MFAAAALFAGAAGASPKGADWAVIDTAEGCASCHLGSPDPTDTQSVSIEGLPERVQAAESYPLEIVLADPAVQIAGFLLAATNAEPAAGTPASARAPAGSFASVDATTEADGARARSTRAGALPRTPGVVRWKLVWTAPAEAAGPIRFELRANAGNDDLSPLGDRLQRRIWEIPAAD